MSKKGKGCKELDVVAAARQLGCRLDTLYLLLRGGRIPGAEKREGRWVIPQSAVEARIHARQTRTRAGRVPVPIAAQMSEVAKARA